MTRVLIMTQGGLAKELARAAATIAGGERSIDTLTLDWKDDLESAADKLAHSLETVGTEEGVLILTDLPGGTPFNVARRFAEPERVEVLSGVNLSMVVRLCCPGCREDTVADLADWIQKKGRESICRASDTGGNGAGGGAAGSGEK